MTAMQRRRIDHDADWLDVANQWNVRDDTIYLNHGSFGPPPNPVAEAKRDWLQRMECQPMDFFCRHFEQAVVDARGALARFVGTNRKDLVLCDNATAAMNIVARSFPLSCGDQVLLTNHEYGAVHRIWQRACEQTGAQLRVANLPVRCHTSADVLHPLLAAVSASTRLIVVSHITSPTAIIFPIVDICREAADRDIPVCVDGPHAVATLDLALDRLGCAFYTASCHKWLSASLGSGFLYVHPAWQDRIQPMQQSWGRLQPEIPHTWDEEFTWPGTRDATSLFTIPDAIVFLENIGCEAFRQRTHWLAQYARRALEQLFNTMAIVPDSTTWYQTMTLIPLPVGNHAGLQQQLWKRFHIEVPIIQFEDNWYIRVSCHLYNSTSHIDLLVKALAVLCRSGGG
ncbi:MAG: aminotransferase class V-fold PLP-dependent enzyme [Pirellulaceae bacterium]|nr:aminotransferase class V-fold PLP-dependent enzyme [Planctomycetales bacterium]